MSAPAPARPNVLFIVADDLNAWIGALGRHPDAITPNIDALAARGTLFTHAYCSAPYCNASRMGVFTGCLPATTGIYQNEPFWQAPGRRRTLVERFRDAGYYTIGAGKVFHGVFDYAVAGRKKSSLAPWCEIENRADLWNRFAENVADALPDGRPLNGMFDFSNFDAVPPMYRAFDWGPLPDDRIEDMPDAAVARTIGAFLRRPEKEPFFCAAGLYKPHLPWHVPNRFFDLYDVDTLSLPVVKEDDLDDVPPIARNWALSPPDHELVIRHRQWRPAVRAYLASISYCDYVIGELIAALDAGPAAKETIVVLWGDNGFHLGEKLHWRKFVLWEEATLVPLIVTLPGQRGANRRFNEPVSLTDIFPTLLDLCGLAPEGGIDGESLSSTLRGAQMQRARPVTMTWGRGNHSIRTRDWRYTRYSDRTEELYDHTADAHEWTNLARTKAFESICKTLRRSLPRL
ncbi:MAG TPA: sulfatase [Candidatus Tumulicola sp.]|jgi:arylsulfatase A-like enzyme